MDDVQTDGTRMPKTAESPSSFQCLTLLESGVGAPSYKLRCVRKVQGRSRPPALLHQMLEHTMYLCSRWAARVKSKKSASEIVLSISPIEELPTEILMLIFEEYCDNWSPADKTSLPQLCLSQVNRQWRSIAVSLASLWTKLAITPQFSSYIVSVYLKRSQQLPLDLDLDLRYEATDDFKRDRVLTIWKAVKSSADRWRRLTLQLGPQDASAVSEDLRELEAPLLEELEITSSSHVSGITTILDCGAPSLRHLRLIGMSLQRFGPALDQLTKLDLTTNCPMQFTVFKGLCKKMVKLEELTLRSRVVEAWPLYPSKDEIIPLPALKVLKVSDRRWPLFIPLLSISAPALHTLSLYDLVAHDLPDTFMEPQLRDNYPSIRNLILKGKSSFIDDASFAQLTRVFPDIDHFALLGVDESFVRESSLAMQQTSIWPKLRTISMMPVAGEEMLCSLISARTVPTAEIPLKTVIVPQPTPFRRLGSITEQVSIEECELSTSFSFSHFPSESAFAAHKCTDPFKADVRS